MISLPRWSGGVTFLASPSRYGIAVGAAVVAALVRLALERAWGAHLPFITFFPAIMVSAWLGGFGPGLVTTAVSATTAFYFWLVPVRSFWISEPTDWLGLVVFVSVGIVISAMNEVWRRGLFALAESEQRLAVTLASIGDAVLTTNNHGRITRMNGVAETLTGWRAADAIGRPLEEVFVVIDTHTPGKAENPVRRVLREGVVTSLSNMLLASADGRTIPIDDSAAPIRSDDGRTAGAIMVFRDITERRRSEDERNQRDLAARQLAAIVESSDDAIVSKDLESTIRSWNRGAERIFGYTAAEMIGRSIRVIIPDDRWSEEDDVLRQIRRGEKVDHFETVRRRKDGSEVPVSLTISPIYSPDGVVIGASKIARDISERKQVEAERAQMLLREQHARTEVERASHVKDDFLATLSHELRTPLNAVLGYAQLLTSAVLPAERIPHAYQAIQRNAQAQARLVESLLDLSRVLAGKLELSVEDITLSTPLEAAVDAVRPDAVRKGIVLDVSPRARALSVSGDPVRLQQVFWNLLTNAIKFTPSGGRVAVRAIPDGPHARVEISDTGCGIEADLLPYVFDRFRQAKGEAARVSGGLGLGLALVREMVHAHGGTVSAQSEGEGRGSTFTVRLPLAQTATLGRSNVSETGRSTAVGGESHADVLIVDDERDAREMLSLILTTQGATVRSVASASEALDAMRHRRPDVVLADVGMPEEDGYSMMRRWRALERELGYDRVPAVAVTAFATTKDRDRAVSAGFDWHVAKPIDLDELGRVLGTAAGFPRAPLA
ncbi:MAG TPA: PAS domain S-box protein [Vicinamibacterales bacterium]